jgi:hypothetical protein
MSTHLNYTDRCETATLIQQFCGHYEAFILKSLNCVHVRILHTYCNQVTPLHQNLKIHHCLNKSSPPVPILSQLNPVHTPPAISPRSILIPSSDLCLGVLSALYPLGFPARILYTSLLSHVCHMPCPPHSPWLHLSNIWGWGHIMKLLIVQLPPFSCYFITVRSKYSP